MARTKTRSVFRETEYATLRARQPSGKGKAPIALRTAESASDPAQLQLGLSSGNVSGERFCCTKLLIHNYNNFQVSAPPSRLMFFDNGEWRDFASNVVEMLRQDFTDGRPTVELLIDGSRYLFDFLRMIQINFETETSWSISWIDEEGRCFFPKFFFEKDESHFPQSEKTKFIKSLNLLKRSRAVVESESESASPEYTPEKVPRMVEVFKWPKAKLMREEENEYILVKDYFLSGIKKVDSGAAVTSIYKCTRDGPYEKTRFDLFHQQIELTKFVRGPEGQKTRYAWHAASYEEMTKILTYGFMSPTKVPESELYGTGAYLSSVHRPELSVELTEVDENGEKHVLLCRILVGEMEQLDQGSKQDHATDMKYDSGTDDPCNPKWHVIWTYSMNTHILPEYILSYKPSNGEREPSAVELIGAACNGLPAEMFEEVVKIYKAWKEEVITKEEFVKRFRFMAGDNVIRLFEQAIMEASG